MNVYFHWLSILGVMKRNYKILVALNSPTPLQDLIPPSLRTDQQQHV